MKEGFSIVAEVVLPSDYQSLIDVEKIVGSVCDEFGVQEDAFGNVLIAVSEAVKEIRFIYYILKDIGIEVELPIVVKSDNVGACFGKIRNNAVNWLHHQMHINNTAHFGCYFTNRFAN